MRSWLTSKDWKTKATCKGDPSVGFHHPEFLSSSRLDRAIGCNARPLVRFEGTPSGIGLLEFGPDLLEPGFGQRVGRQEFGRISAPSWPP